MLVSVIVFSLGYETSTGSIIFVYTADICSDAGISFSFISMWIFTIIVSGIAPFLIMSKLKAFGKINHSILYL